MRRGRKTRLMREFVLLAPVLLLAITGVARATYLRVFLGSDSLDAGVDVEWVETRVKNWDAAEPRWIVQTRSIDASDAAAFSTGQLEAASFGPLRPVAEPKYEIVVILQHFGTWLLYDKMFVSVGPLGADVRLWMPATTLTSTPSRPPLFVSKTDTLVYDADGDGQVTVGDHVAYTVDVTNLGLQGNLWGVVYEERNDAVFQGQLFVNEASATVTKDGIPDTSAVTFQADPPGSLFSRKITANIDYLGIAETALVDFEVVIGQLGTLGRGYAWADDTERAVASDDPDQPGPEDPTIIPITFTGPNVCRAQLPISVALATDYDSDGLITADEIDLGTDPLDADSDDDGLDDFTEVMGADGIENSGDETDPLDSDTDNDQIPDGSDNCVLVRNKFQENDDGDAYGNLCDGCPSIFSYEQADLDRDGAWDVCDVCPLTHDPDQLDDHGFPAAGPDGTGNACQNWDFDADGRADGGDVMLARAALAEAAPAPATAMPPRGCATGVVEQAFTPEMSGCEGAIDWASRASLCETGWSVCTAAEWVARRHGKQPTASYWTNDELVYGGTSSGNCWVHEITGTACNPGVPMRVCAGNADHLGNTCNWTGCGYHTQSNEYFGGCVGNPTAGTLCCR